MVGPRVGLGLIGAQFAALCGLSTLIDRRFALTEDFAHYFQAWTLIGRGNLNPFSTSHSFAFLSDHAAVLMWPLALLSRLSGSSLTLLFVQAGATAGASAVAFTWALELLGRTSPNPHVPRRALAWLAVALLVANPWTYFATAWDFHFEALGALFAVLALRDLQRRDHWRSTLWLALLLATGDVAGTYVVGIGVTLLLWRRVRVGAVVGVVGLSWVVGVTVLKLNQGSTLSAGYGYLAYPHGAPSTVTLSHLVLGVATHPTGVMTSLWSRRVDVWANLAPAGLVGIVSPIGAGMPGIVLVEAMLNHSFGLAIAQPSFQSLPAYTLVPVATVVMLGRLSGATPRRARAVKVACACLALDTLAWGAVWLPKLEHQWVPVSGAAASVLRKAAAEIPRSAEVVVSQGIAGRFAARPFVYPILSFGDPVPIRTTDVWVILAPSQGIETATVNETLAAIGAFAPRPGVTLAERGGGVWVFRWQPGAATSLTFPHGAATVGAWTTPGAAGTVSLVGGPDEWATTSTGVSGYVVAGDYWRGGAGRYSVTARLQAGGPVQVEAWDATERRLLWRRPVDVSSGMVTLRGEFGVTDPIGVGPYQGVGPFRIRAATASPGDDLEVRVWSPGATDVRVYTVSIQPVPAQPVPAQPVAERPAPVRPAALQ